MKMAGAIGQGRLSIKQIRELKEASVDIKNMILETLGEGLFEKTVDAGDFDEEEVYEKIPADLGVDFILIGCSVLMITNLIDKPK